MVALRVTVIPSREWDAGLVEFGRKEDSMWREHEDVVHDR